MRFKLFSRLIVFTSPVKIYRLPTLLTVGITNRTEDNYFVLFLDYDNVEYSVVREDVDFLQKNFDVGTVITRVSSLVQSNWDEYNEKEVGNYHVIGFTKFTFPEIKELISLTRCDSHFKKGYKYQQRCWVLRIGEKFNEKGETIKPFTVLREVIKSSTRKEANLGFIRFFEKLDGIKLSNYFKKQDKNLNVELIRYATR